MCKAEDPQDFQGMDSDLFVKATGSVSFSFSPDPVSKFVEWRNNSIIISLFILVDICITKYSIGKLF